ncbi:MAG TPA: dihydrolipoyl dehydrogenase [Desulfobacteraceae bacterium]|nr:dihydrolipoyl dehydrogenase [Desulfobacteraceae bacterium]
MKESRQKYDLAVIGAGPAGYVAAVRAAQLGLNTVCIEKDASLGGVCLNAGCIPSKALLDSSELFHQASHNFADHGISVADVRLDLAAMMARKEKVVADLTQNVRALLERNKVEIVQGAARLTHADRIRVTNGKETTAIQAAHILLATGSVPVDLPDLPVDGKVIVGSTEALNFDTVPERLGIVGGGYVGLELGSVWQRLGSKVTVIEMLPRAAAGLDGQVARTLTRELKRQGLSLKLKTRVADAKVKNGNVTVSLVSDKGTETATFDKLLVSVGRRPSTDGLGLADAGVEIHPDSGRIKVDASFCTSVPSIYAVGDLIDGPMLAHKASAEGVAAVECMAGLPGEVNYDAVPSVVYTAPEVAGVGLTEETLKSRDIPYRSGVYPFSGTARARCLGETLGFVKVLAHQRTDRILGVHIIGPRASDLISEAVLAMEMGASSEDLARTVHGHPTFSEAIQEAAAGLLHS